MNDAYHWYQNDVIDGKEVPGFLRALALWSREGFDEEKLRPILGTNLNVETFRDYIARFGYFVADVRLDQWLLVLRKLRGKEERKYLNCLEELQKGLEGNYPNQALTYDAIVRSSIQCPFDPREEENIGSSVESELSRFMGDETSCSKKRKLSDENEVGPTLSLSEARKCLFAEAGDLEREQDDSSEDEYLPRGKIKKIHKIYYPSDWMKVCKGWSIFNERGEYCCFNRESVVPMRSRKPTALKDTLFTCPVKGKKRNHANCVGFMITPYVADKLDEWLEIHPDSFYRYLLARVPFCTCRDYCSLAERQSSVTLSCFRSMFPPHNMQVVWKCNECSYATDPFNIEDPADISRHVKKDVRVLREPKPEAKH